MSNETLRGLIVRAEERIAESELLIATLRDLNSELKELLARLEQQGY